MRTIRIFVAGPMILLLIIAACKKKEDDTGIIDTSAITEFDEYAKPSGSVDPTDWKFDDIFTPEEKALFPEDSRPICDLDYSQNKVLAFPNPNNGSFSFGTDLTKNKQILLRIVDENLNILYKNDSLFNNSISFDEIQKGGNYGNRTVRLYYRIMVDSTCKAQGHGDIRIN